MEASVSKVCSLLIQQNKTDTFIAKENGETQTCFFR